jgi:hypothetical protein
VKGGEDASTSEREPSHTNCRRAPADDGEPLLLEDLINIYPARTSTKPRNRLIGRERHTTKPTHVNQQPILNTRCASMVPVSSTLDRKQALVFAHDLDGSRYVLGRFWLHDA